VRAGLHTGECEVRGDDIGGIAVHIGARVSALAGRNDVLVSTTLRDVVIGSGLEFEERGSHELKGVPGECLATVVVRLDDGLIAHHVEVSLRPDWIGGIQYREAHLHNRTLETRSIRADPARRAIPRCRTRLAAYINASDATQFGSTGQVVLPVAELIVLTRELAVARNHHVVCGSFGDLEERQRRGCLRC
jgi:Lipocalin-like domain